MDIRINPTYLFGYIDAVTSKSDAHRILLCSFLCNDTVKVYINTFSEDIIATIECIREMGSIVDVHNDHVVIKPSGKKYIKDLYTFNCMESGSTLRFLVPITAALGIDCVFTGTGRLPARPLSPLYELLMNNGVKYIKPDSCILPLNSSGLLKPGKFVMNGNVSSQFTTGLLLALPLLNGDSQIVLTPPIESKPYIDMTLNTLSTFGINVSEEIYESNTIYNIPGNQTYKPPGELYAEGDWSNSSFWFAAGAINRNTNQVSIKGLNPLSCQGDKFIADYVKKAGCSVMFNDGIYTVANITGKLTASDIDASQVPDLVPILSVIASVSEGTTHIYNAGRLRIKESDRLLAVCDNLTRLGADVTEKNDGLYITGKPYLEGGNVQSYNDHRIVMASAISSIVCRSSVAIENAEAVNKSYPKFFEDFKKLGGNFNVINLRQ